MIRGQERLNTFDVVVTKDENEIFRPMVLACTYSPYQPEGFLLQ
jgi:hypothetical protein